MKKIITVMLCIVLVLLFAGMSERTTIHQKWKLIMEHLPFIQKKK